MSSVVRDGGRGGKRGRGPHLFSRKNIGATTFSYAPGQALTTATEAGYTQRLTNDFIRIMLHAAQPDFSHNNFFHLSLCIDKDGRRDSLKPASLTVLYYHLKGSPSTGSPPVKERNKPRRQNVS